MSELEKVRETINQYIAEWEARRETAIAELRACDVMLAYYRDFLAACTEEAN